MCSSLSLSCLAPCPEALYQSIGSLCNPACTGLYTSWVVHPRWKSGRLSFHASICANLHLVTFTLSNLFSEASTYSVGSIGKGRPERNGIIQDSGIFFAQETEHVGFHCPTVPRLVRLHAFAHTFPTFPFFGVIRNHPFNPSLSAYSS